MDYLEIIWSLRKEKSILIWIKQIKWYIWTLKNGRKPKNVYAEKEKIIFEREGIILSQQMSIRMEL